MRALPLILVIAIGCKKPSPAPDGLDASANYMMQHFYDDDDLFGAGIEGFLQWYDEEGSGLVDEGATLDTVNSYTVGDLSDAAVGHLPLDDEILVDFKKEEWAKRDVQAAKGVVSLAVMDCTWDESERYLLRPDQDTIFEDTFETYERTYLSDRAAYEQGARDADFDAIKENLSPFVPEFDRTAFAKTLLMTENTVDPSSVLGANMDPYPMNLDLRHGEYDWNGETVGVSAIITYNIGAAWGTSGANALLQSFSIELNVSRPGNKTLRMLTVWTEPKGGGIDADSAIALNFAVNKALESSERLSAVCAGEVEIPKE